MDGQLEFYGMLHGVLAWFFFSLEQCKSVIRLVRLGISLHGCVAGDGECRARNSPQS